MPLFKASFVIALDVQANIPPYLTATNGSIELIQAKAYISKGIAAGLILGMDGLGKEEVDNAFQLGRKMIQLGSCHVAASKLFRTCKTKKQVHRTPFMPQKLLWGHA